MTNRLGLHVRPAGRIVELVASHDATLELRNTTRGTGPTDGRSLTGLALLRATQGDELEAAARGPQASELLAALRALADDNFGDAARRRRGGHAAAGARADRRAASRRRSHGRRRRRRAACAPPPVGAGCPARPAPGPATPPPPAPSCRA